MKIRVRKSPGTFNSLALILALPILFVSPGLLAQESGWYAGIGAGRAGTDVERGRIIANLEAGGYSTSGFASDDKDSAYKILGGYSFNRHLGLEAGYFNLGSFDFNATLQPGAVQGGKASVDGFGADLVGTWPLANKLAAFVRVGINNARIEQDFTNNQIGTGFIDRTDRGVNEKFGAGLQYAFNDAVHFRAELERFRVNSNRVIDDHVNTFTAGVVYRFGSRKPAAVPAPRLAEPAPAPARAPAPASRQPVQVTLSASTLFDFDKSALKPEGREALDELVRDIQGLNYEVVIVTGHTDRIGTRNYNLALSQRRADTVRDYLIRLGVPGRLITARGVNSDEPLTGPQQCSGPVSDVLKACLQPDRRVVVEVTGTRD